MCEDVLYSSILFYFAEHITNIHGDFVYYVQAEASSTGLGGSVVKFKKNIEDILLVFDFLKTIFIDMIQDQSYWKNIEAWEEFLLSKWNYNIQKSKFPKWQKKELQKKIISYLVEHSLSIQPLNDFFYFIATSSNHIPNENIKKMIVSDDHKIISFDVFDTLVHRPFWTPMDLFYLLGLYATDILSISDLLDFKT